MKVILALFIAIGTAVCHAELFEGDIILDPNTLKIVEGQNTFDAVKSDTKKWKNGRVPYIFDSNFEDSRKQVVRQAIAEYNKYTCIRFVPRTIERNYVRFIIGDGCYSSIGMVGGAQNISIGQGCQEKGIVMHEMMHASGFWHEQSRLDRDNYVRVYWGNISNDMNYNFKKYTHGEADYYGEGYDYDSIMHYGNWYFSKNGKMTIEVVSDPYKIVGQRDGFSQTDVRQLNKVYRCKGYENVKVPALKGCIDMSNGCTSSAQRGECDRSPRYMLKYCCKSCKEFREGTVSSCKDENKQCPIWVSQTSENFCVTNDYVKKVCKKSCKYC